MRSSVGVGRMKWGVGTGILMSRMAVGSQDQRTSHPYHAGTDYAGSSKTRQVLLEPSADRGEVHGESREV